MTPDSHWDRVEALFEAAGEIPAPEREAFLRREADGDEALVAETLALLRHGATAEAEWGESAADFAGPLLGETEARSGDQIGTYRLERELGRGGMGTVWLAHRTDDLRLRVALKVVRRGLDTADVRHRFRQEHRLLAALDHPHIARLLDGGVTADGLPYFVMEYVDGEPIDAYCDRRQLPVEARLRLFGDVCAAVQYAHQRLVVHRDLKPSNILVAEADGGTGPPRPVVKLLDFGIAKVLQPDRLGLSGLFTRAEHRMLTPAYASPEQLRGESVTTASDVFGLGVLLYELLTGHPPRPRRPPAPVDPDPVRPSEAVRRTETVARSDGTTRTVTPADVAAARGAPTERLRRSLAGDLDTVVLMALRREPERRYASAAELADDVARHLAGQTVRARPDTVGYRASAFVRRHRLGVAAAALFVVLLAGFAATTAVERGRTAREAARARAVADVLGGLFAATNPTVAQGDTLTVYEFLQRSEGRLRGELAGQPDVLAEVLGVIGGAYRDMTQFDRAEPALRDALALRRATRGPRHPLVADALGELATLQFMRDDLDGALATARERLALLRSLYGDGDPRLVPAYGRIAAVHLQAHRLDSARVWLDAGLAITRPRQRADPERHLGLVGLDGWYYAETGDHAASVRVAREILALHRRTGAPLADVALAERILGDQLFETGDFAGATRALDRSLADYRRVFGPSSRYVALVAGHLAAAHAAAGHAALADSLFPVALTSKARFFGPDSPEAGHTLLAAGRHALRQGRPAEADRLLARAEALWSAARGPESAERRQASALRALARYDTGQRDAAADTLEAIWDRARNDRPDRSRAVIQLALRDLRRRQGRTADADAFHRAAAPLLRASPLRREVGPPDRRQ